MLLQSADVLRQPGVLLRLCEAVVRELPLACVTVLGKGYDFAKARQLLASPLKQQLSGQACDDLLPYLAHKAYSITKVGRAIEGTIPFIIAVQFDPIGTPAHMNAAIKDLADKLEQMRGHIRRAPKVPILGSNRQSGDVAVSV